jgi:hypothetical protein
VIEGEVLEIDETGFRRVCPWPKEVVDQILQPLDGLAKLVDTACRQAVATPGWNPATWHQWFSRADQTSSGGNLQCRPVCNRISLLPLRCPHRTGSPGVTHNCGKTISGWRSFVHHPQHAPGKLRPT